MKRCFLFILGIAFILAKAQADELPFAVGGYPTIWVWDEETVNAEFPAFWHTNFHTREGDIFNLTHKIVGDSVVNGKTYGRMVFGYETKDDLLKGIGLYPWGLPHGKTEYADTLLYRQEGDQVFCIPKGKQEEILIIDFGLKAGDSFVDATGEQFRVEYAGMLWEDFTDDWITVANVRIRCLYWLQSPKMLKMVSQRTGETDIWIEGIGSLNWGVVPLFVAEGIEPFRHLNQHPRKAQVCVGAPENMNVMPNVNGEEYKAVQIVDWKYAYDDDDSLEFSFEKDTLCIRGIQEVMSHTGLFYAECLITESRIDFMVKQNEVNGLVRIAFDVKIPGFKPGTYEVSLNGKDCVTALCNGATGVESPTATGFRASKYAPIYDLSGRPVATPRRGIYIHNGRKVVK